MDYLVQKNLAAKTKTKQNKPYFIDFYTEVENCLNPKQTRRCQLLNEALKSCLKKAWKGNNFES